MHVIYPVIYYTVGTQTIKAILDKLIEIYNHAAQSAEEIIINTVI